MTTFALTCRFAALSSVVLAAVACSPSASTPSNERWTGNVSDVRVQWFAEPGIDLSTGVAVPIRAYLESYDLVQFTGALDNAYPGFTDAVPPNESRENSEDSSTWDRRPSGDVSVGSKLTGNLQYRLKSAEPQSGNGMTAVVCRYTYGLGEQQTDGTIAQFAKSGFAENRGITGVRLTLVAPGDPAVSELPSQTGPALAPSDNVFDGWRITGYRTTAGASYEEWPDKDEVERSCSSSAPDSLEVRQVLIRGPHSETDFAPSAPSPGWPEAPSQ
ncbi:hypothetical protein [Mycolicibacterium goodii]|uniref:hypothetical protein n=1 Tax=Mycolicibacterium goodii TaxID=134601 RepID=UPI0010557689|nr:hypothetical protein [Mycolicibacterium goodii]